MNWIAGRRRRSAFIDENPNPPLAQQKCGLHPLIHTFDPSIFTPRYGSSVSNRKVGIKVIYTLVNSALLYAKHQ
jgi:hypothetical protein